MPLHTQLSFILRTTDHWLKLSKELKYKVAINYLIYQKSLAFLSLYSINQYLLL
ncbi:hypothetical protein PROSTU_02298 [Providencia stuartii ATCC 25827]|uniref:Uncharacterized protein n=1 Tax=Providencia stuartii ATCC 25827 TaxID=471874 RepID=A0AA86YRY6_PROST|nr:hypothetical protein PROSTU_02298 [Providencia stuartii ATCC 25827]